MNNRMIRTEFILGFGDCACASRRMRLPSAIVTVSFCGSCAYMASSETQGLELSGQSLEHNDNNNNDNINNIKNSRGLQITTLYIWTLYSNICLPTTQHFIRLYSYK